MLASADLSILSPAELRTLGLMALAEHSTARLVPYHEIYRSVLAGRLPVVRVGRRIYATEAAVREWLASRTEQGVTPRASGGERGRTPPQGDGAVW